MKRFHSFNMLLESFGQFTVKYPAPVAFGILSSLVVTYWIGRSKAKLPLISDQADSWIIKETEVSRDIHQPKINNSNVAYNYSNVPNSKFSSDIAESNRKIIPLKCSYYLHRDKAVESVSKYLKEKKCVLINGQEGSGKKQIAIGFSEKYSKQYYAIFFINNSLAINDQYRDIAKSIDIEFSGIKSLKEIINSINKKLEIGGDRKVLLVHLNVDLNTIFKKYYPDGLPVNWEVIVTSRSHACQYDFPSITLSDEEYKFSTAEAKSLLKNVPTSFYNEEIANELATMFDGSPYMLNFAVDKMIKGRQTMSNFLLHYKNELILSTINEVDSHNKLAFKILDICSYINDSNIPYELIMKFFHKSYSQDALYEALEYLAGACLIHNNLANDNFSLRTIIVQKEIEKYRVKNSSGLSSWKGFLLRENKFLSLNDIYDFFNQELYRDYYNDNNSHYYKQYSKYIPHMQKLIEHFDVNRMYYEKAWLLIHIAEIYRNGRLNNDAMNFYKLAEEECSKIITDKRKIISRLIFGISTINYREKRITDTDVKNLYHAYKLRKEFDSVADEISLFTAEAYSNYGGALIRQHKYEEALKVFDDILMAKSVKSVQGVYRRSICHQNKANIYRCTGRYEQAQEELDIAISLYGSLYGGNDPHIPALLNAKGKIYVNTGNNEEAISCFKKSINICVSRIGQDNLYAHHLAQGFLCLSEIYLIQHEYALALKYCEKFLKDSESLFPNGSDDLKRALRVKVKIMEAKNESEMFSIMSL